MFLSRPNRFLVLARIGGRRVAAASRDPGRLDRLLVPGARVLLAAADPTGRRTSYTLMLVRRGRQWVPLVPALANRILEAALQRDGVPGLEGARILRREVVCGDSRFDFLLSHQGSRLWTEVKSVTVVTRRTALFPDAPTTRGLRQLQQLTRLGSAAQLVFVVQRAGADAVAPFRERDPAFAEALAAAARAGVQLRAYSCLVTRAGVRLDRPLPVRVD